MELTAIEVFILVTSLETVLRLGGLDAESRETRETLLEKLAPFFVHVILPTPNNQVVLKEV